MDRYLSAQWFTVLFLLVAPLALAGKAESADPPDPVRALYLSHRFDEKSIDSFLHYAEQTGINAAVLHVKDPQGKLYWNSRTPLAREINAVHQPWMLSRALGRLQENRIWTIAKLDIFADDLLASKHPEMAIATEEGNVWKDKNGLGWTNPHHPQVRKYILDLAGELIGLGFDEIQFDYIRFPSDGDMASIKYPFHSGVPKSQAISSFLAEASEVIRPKALFSVDVFGMVAWKRECFGIGQVLEAMAPHVDVICPMLYPSHFPPNFLGWKNPEGHPREIMRISLNRMKARTGTAIRPWIQGFWYDRDEVNAQLDGTLQAGIKDWLVWNPGARYGVTYQALAHRYDIRLSKPVLYPSLDALLRMKDRVVQGKKKIVNYTNYADGFSILSLDVRSAYATPAAMLTTLDESIIDHVLRTRNIPFTNSTTRSAKGIMLARIMSADLETLPTRMRPVPIYLDWKKTCTFSFYPPPEAIASYNLLSSPS
ncbi:MAG: putative glycoside hydrolase [Desulfovibrionales bacterium]